MPRYRFNVTQHRKQNWVVEVEADSVGDARGVVLYGFDDVEGAFIEDTEGLMVLEEDAMFEDLEFVDTEVTI